MPHCHINRERPGAGFAFKPGNSLASRQRPDFSNLPQSLNSKATGTSTNTTSLVDSDWKQCLYTPTNDYSGGLHELTTMVHENPPFRPPSFKAPLRDRSPNEEPLRRAKSPDSDTDIGALINSKGWASVKSVARDEDSSSHNPFNPTSCN